MEHHPETMTPKSAHTPRQASLLPWLACLAIVFGLLTSLVSVFILVKIAGQTKTLPSILGQMLTSRGLVIDLLHFAFFFFAVHLLLGVIWHLIWKPIDQRVFANRPLLLRGPAAIFAFLPVLLWITLANGIRHPQSYLPFAPDVADSALLRGLWSGSSLYLLSVILLSATLAAPSFYRWLRVHSRHLLLPSSTLVGIGILISGSAIVAALWTDSGHASADREQPDVLIIGFDSLRVDHVGLLAESRESLTPNIDSFLSGAAVFDEAWTPFGRTFPAWMSILTGAYPSSHGGIFNLVSRNRIDDARSLPRWMGQLGYHRIYSIDETRFSNIDESYGFDEVVAPLIGAADFLLGIAGDSPLPNLIANTSIGRHLFPATHGNRAMSGTYRPGTFDRTLARSIRNVDPDTPLFLSVHYELPHWPYTWADIDEFDVAVPSEINGLSDNLYQRTVARVDQQFALLLRTLAEAGRLDNTIVVMLSDHGEAFIESEPEWQPRSDGSAELPRYAGHGTNVLSTAQYQVILAFRGYGRQENQMQVARHRDTTVSLADIEPTLGEWLAAPEERRRSRDGISLLAAIRGEPLDFPEPRVIPLESGFSLTSMKLGAPDQVEIMDQAAHYYEITDDGRMTIGERWIPELLRRKQRAVVSGDWILAAMPRDEDSVWELILANHAEHTYWNARHPETPEHAPLHALLQGLCGWFGRDPTFTLAECSQPTNMAATTDRIRPSEQLPIRR